MSSLLTVEEIVDDLLAKLEADDRAALLEIGAERKLISLHHGFGTHIRNSYGLWTDSPLTKRWREDPSSHDIQDGCDCSADHPDSVSMKIIEALWIKLAKEQHA